MRRSLALLGTVGLSLGIAVVGAPGAQAKALSIGQCSTSQNVIVAVDFGRWDGPVVRACGSTPTTGFDLLNQGGFRTEGTQHDGPAFVCRIRSSEFGSSTGYPTKAQDACSRTPPATAYWSYWHAEAGQDSWSYSQLGAMSYKPKPGSVDLWQFGGTDVGGTKGQPTISPDDVRARNTSSSDGGDSGSKAGGVKNGGAAKPGGNDSGGGAAGDSRPTAPGNAAGTPSAARPSARPGSATATTGASRPGAPTTTRASSAASAAASSGSSSSRPAVIDADPASATSAAKDSGSATPVFLGLGLAVVLGAGAWFTMRRRRAEPEL